MNTKLDLIVQIGMICKGSIGVKKHILKGMISGVIT